MSEYSSYSNVANGLHRGRLHPANAAPPKWPCGVATSARQLCGARTHARVHVTMASGRQAPEPSPAALLTPPPSLLAPLLLAPSLAPAPAPHSPLTQCSRRAGRGVSRSAASGGSAATAPHGAEGATAAAAGGTAASHAASYELPEHWQEQMSRAPLGRKRVLQRYYADVIAINQLEPTMRALSNAQLRGKTAEFRSRLAAGESLQSLRVEAFAVVREAARRVLGMRHYDCQLVGGMVLSEGQVAEMATGEGKTLVATLPGYLGALGGRGVHVVTVNDYLAARDAAWMGKVYRFLGLSCAAVQSTSSPAAARAAFAADVTYVTGQELAFSFLRDNTALSPQDLTLREGGCFHFAIVDEVDSILIDESRNPLIISGKGACDSGVVRLVDRAVRRLWNQVQSELAASRAAALRGAGGGELSDPEVQRLEKAVKGRYYTVDEKTRTVSYTQAGTHLVFLFLRDEGAQFRDPYPGVHSLWEEEVPWGRMAVTALTAYELYVNGRDYIVREGEAVIVDPSTGRLRVKTRWQGGVHQAVEAKEGLSIQAENLVTATITFQLFFAQYEWLAGMTGTAQPAAAELFELYGIKVVPVPTNRPSRRTDHPPRLYPDKALKMHALAEQVVLAAEDMRPVLIGTTSVQESELVLAYLNRTVAPAMKHIQAARRRRAAVEAAAAAAWGGGVAGSAAAAVAAGGGGGPKPRITLLNAKPEFVRQEAQVIAQAGLPGAVTIATNMAGRGTDIILGGNPEGLTKLALMRLLYGRLLRASERRTLPSVPLSQLDPYDTDDFAALTRIPHATPDHPHAGLPRPLHEVLSTAILISFAAVQQQQQQQQDQQDEQQGGARGGGEQQGRGQRGQEEEEGVSNGDGDGVALSSLSEGELEEDEVEGGRKGGGDGDGGGSMSYEQAAQLVVWVMDRAEVLRRKVRGALRRTYRDHPGGLETLDYTLCVAPLAAAVLAERDRRLYDNKTSNGGTSSQQGGLEAAAAAAAATAPVSAGSGSAANSYADDEEAMEAAGEVAAAGTGAVAVAGEVEDEGEEPPVAQAWALKAALYLWLWFDQECARYREEVCGAGGLLVIGTSLNESPRIELQLRGRAGRQGDPGETLLLLDCADPLMAVFGLDKVSVWLNSVSNGLQVAPDYVDGPPVELLLRSVVRFQESAFQSMRLESKKYDGVMEEYRSNLYTLRRLVLCGGDMQRAQIAYVLIQRYVDEVVDRYLDPRCAPSVWLRESVPAGEVLGAGGRGGGGEGGAAEGGEEGRLVSPLQAVLQSLHALLNPPARTTKTRVDWGQLARSAAGNATVRKMLALFGVTKGAGGHVDGDGGGSSTGGDNDRGTASKATSGGGGGGEPSYLPVYNQVEELELLSPAQLRNLAEYLADVGPLEWPVPAALEVRNNFKLQLQLRTHRRLFGYGEALQSAVAGATAGAATDAAAGKGDEQAVAAAAAAEIRQRMSSGAPTLIQRPALRGRFAEKVAVLRNYLGELLIGCYESRRLAARLTLTAAPGLDMTDIDAEQQVCSFEQQTMLAWLDALWSCFLEDTGRLRSAVQIRSSGAAGLNPLEEFRREANAAFLALLDNYRDAVLDKLLVPDFGIMTSLEMGGEEEEEEVREEREAGQLGAAASAVLERLQERDGEQEEVASTDDRSSFGGNGNGNN